MPVLGDPKFSAFMRQVTTTPKSQSQDEKPKPTSRPSRPIDEPKVVPRKTIRPPVEKPIQLQDLTRSQSMDKKALILIVALVAIVINQLFWVYNDRKKEAYKNTPAGLAEIEIEKMKERRKLAEVEGVKSSQQHTAAVSASATSAVFEVKDGSEVILAENSKITIRGPVTAVFVDSGNKIKTLSGDFKISIDNSQNLAWTPGFSQESSPMSTAEFIQGLRRVHGAGLVKHRVRIQVNQGAVVQLET